MSTVFYSFLLVLAILHSDLCKKLGMMDRERSIDKKSLEERKNVTAQNYRVRLKMNNCRDSTLTSLKMKLS